jgi:hypothetical protein
MIEAGATKQPKKQRQPRAQAGGIRQRAWWVIRKRKSVTLNELLDVLATADQPSMRHTLIKYLRALVYAGLLSVRTKRENDGLNKGHSYFRYDLEIDNGRLAPLWRQDFNEIYDPNNKKSYPIKKGEKDA